MKLLQFLLTYLLSKAILIFVFCNSASAQSLTLDQVKRTNLSPYLSYFRDTSTTMNLQEIINLKPEKWAPLPKAYPNFGYTDDAVWLKLTLLNSTNQKAYFASEYTCVDYIDMYIIKNINGKLITLHMESGDRRNYSDRDFDHPYPVFPIMLDTSEVDIYVRVQTKGGVQLPLFLVSEKEINSRSYSLWFLDLYWGVVAGVLIFQLLLFFTYRERVFIAHFLFTLAFAVFLSSYYGISIQLWPDNSDLQHHLLAIAMAACACSGSWFARELFVSNKDEKATKLYKLIVYGGVISIFTSFLLDYEYAIAVNFIYILGVIMVAAYYCFGPREDKPHYGATFTIGMVLMISGLVAQLGNELGVPLLGDFIALKHGVLFSGFSQVLILGVVAVQRISKEKNQLDALKMQLFQVEKINAVGRLASGLIHEIKNPLSPIDSIFRLLPKADENMRNEMIVDGREQVARIKDVLDGLYSFAYPSSINDRENFNLSKMILDAHRFVKGNLIDVEFSINIPDNFVIYGGRTHLLQVFVNIFSNAGFAFTQIKGARAKTLEVDLELSTKVLDGVCIIVRDNGPGLSPKTLRHLFEPFYTTGERGQGVGLGMTIVFQIIEQHKGKIGARSIEGKWTEFRIHLPNKRNIKMMEFLRN